MYTKCGIFADPLGPRGKQLRDLLILPGARDRTVARRQKYMTTQCCSVCNSEHLRVFHEMEQIPVHVGVLWPSKQEARHCAKGDVTLAYCTRCGFISNIAFDEHLVDYRLKYNNALHFSPLFQDYERNLAARLIDQYNVRQRRVLEIGCGSGHFLGLLCELGNNRGLGFDPSHDPQDVDPHARGNVSFYSEYYSEEHGSHDVDLICCRHVLEHIPRPADFLQMISRSIAGNPDTVLYFEVPNSRLIFKELSIWDIMYEHCGYFTRESLAYLFRRHGFKILDLKETYDEQFLSIVVSPSKAIRDTVRDGGSPQELDDLVEGFPPRFRAKQDEWRSRLQDMYIRGSRAVVWGAGGKTVGFFTVLAIGERIKHVVDVNPGKQGTYLAGSGQCIITPEALKQLRPDVVIIVNPIYAREITESLRAMGLAPAVYTV